MNVEMQLGWAFALWISVIEREYRLVYRQSLHFIHIAWQSDYPHVLVEKKNAMNNSRVCESNPSLLPPPYSPPSIGTLFQTSQAAKNENLEML